MLSKTCYVAIKAVQVLITFVGAPMAQWVKRWPTDLADRVRSPLEAKSSQP